MGVVLKGGTSTTASFLSWWLLVRLQLAVGRERSFTGVGGWLGTLLGPEGTAGRLFVQGRYAPRCSPAGGWVVRVAAGWYRSDEPLAARPRRGVVVVGRRWGEGAGDRS